MRKSGIFAIAVVLAMVTFAAAQSQRGTGSAPPATKPVAVAATTDLPAGNVQHGRYIAERVAMCVECHSPRDGSGRIIESEKYLGGNIPPPPPWAGEWAPRAPRNRGLLGYDDKAALRLLTAGAIGRDGVQLKPPMPRFRMSTQDAADVIAFLRSLH